jgi:hypothetical protein
MHNPRGFAIVIADHDGRRAGYAAVAAKVCIDVNLFSRIGAREELAVIQTKFLRDSAAYIFCIAAGLSQLLQ